MKKCNCKIGKFFGKLFAIVFGLFAVLFSVFWFDLDGKLIFNVVEPFLKKHYDEMERKDVLKDIYDIDKPHYEYDV